MYNDLFVCSSTFQRIEGELRKVFDLVLYKDMTSRLSLLDVLPPARLGIVTQYLQGKCRCMAIILKRDVPQRILASSRAVNDVASYLTENGLCDTRSCSSQQLFLLLADALYRCLFPRPHERNRQVFDDRCYVETHNWILMVQLHDDGSADAELSLYPDEDLDDNIDLYAVRATRKNDADHFVIHNPLRNKEENMYYRFGKGPEDEWKGTLTTFYDDFKRNAIDADFYHPGAASTVPCEVIFHKLPVEDHEQDLKLASKRSNLAWGGSKKY